MYSSAVILLVAIYGGLNVFSFVLFGLDKWKAVHDRWRIPESKLLLAAVFGVFGALLGMLVFRHKIRKPKFAIGVPAILILELAALAAAFAAYAGDYYRAEDVQAYLRSGEAVSVSETDTGWYFDGAGTEAALIFYPGAKVEATAS